MNTKDFLVKAQGLSDVPTRTHTRDDEQALYLLLQCGYNTKEALRRHRMNVVPPADTMSLWSQEERRNFENGLRLYGKKFHLIQKKKVRSRSVAELVKYYYIWKKTEEHDMLANKTKTKSKKINYVNIMDMFLDGKENVDVTQRNTTCFPNKKQKTR
jgi:hypothetical protein